MSDISQVFEVDDILRVSIVSQVEHHLYFPESFLCTLCMMSPIIAQTEKAHAGNSPPKAECAVFLPDPY